MMKVVRIPSIQTEIFDRPVRRVNCYDNARSISYIDSESMGRLPGEVSKAVLFYSFLLNVGGVNS